MLFDEIFKKEIVKEIMAIDSLPVLAGTVGTLHAASALNTIDDYRYALRCKKAGTEVKTRKRTASNNNNDKGGLIRNAERLVISAPVCQRPGRSRAYLRIV